MPSVVVDTNFVDHPELRSFLEESKFNKVVLTDFVAIEIFKPQDPSAFQRRMTILADHPQQVVILKDTARIRTFSGRAAGLTRRMIDEQQAAEFSAVLKQIRKSNSGSADFFSSIQQRHLQAQEHMVGLSGIANAIMPSYQALKNQFQESDLSIIQKRKALTKSILGVILTSVNEYAASLWSGNPQSGKWPTDEEWLNVFVYRFSLFLHVNFLNWVRNGSPSPSDKKLQNDVIDLFVGTYSTYFDGLFSNDGTLSAITAESEVILNRLSEHIPPS